VSAQRGECPPSLVIKAAVLLPVLFVAACAAVSRVEATTATADGVTYQFPADQQGEATHQAMLYCANLGRNAVLRSAEPEDGDLILGVYDCR